jgi:hypothetical protein
MNKWVRFLKLLGGAPPELVLGLHRAASAKTFSVPLNLASTQADRVPTSSHTSFIQFMSSGSILNLDSKGPQTASTPLSSHFLPVFSALRFACIFPGPLLSQFYYCCVDPFAEADAEFQGSSSGGNVRIHKPRRSKKRSPLVSSTACPVASLTPITAFYFNSQIFVSSNVLVRRL